MRFLLVVLIASGCGYNNTQIPSDALTQQQGASNGDAGVVEFAVVKSQVFQSYCLRCHSQAGGNKAGINLESYTTVKPIVQRVVGAVNAGVMPPSGSLPNSAKVLLMKWVNSGAPEFGSGAVGDGPQNPNPTPITPAPIPCDDHKKMIADGIIVNLDAELYFDYAAEMLKRRGDDCEDRKN